MMNLERFNRYRFIYMAAIILFQSFLLALNHRNFTQVVAVAENWEVLVKRANTNAEASRAVALDALQVCGRAIAALEECGGNVSALNRHAAELPPLIPMPIKPHEPIDYR